MKLATSSSSTITLDFVSASTTHETLPTEACNLFEMCQKYLSMHKLISTFPIVLYTSICLSATKISKKPIGYTY